MYNQLTSVTIPNLVTLIGGDAFFNNRLTLVKIGNSVKTIGQSAFESNRLTSVVIPDSVTSIGRNAFQSNQLTSVTLSQALYGKRGDAFLNNPVGRKFYEYDASKPGKKGARLNINADGSTFITMSDGSTITTRLDGSSHLVIADGVYYINHQKFMNNQLTSVVIPGSVTSIWETAFAGNSTLEKVTISGTGAIKDDAFTYKKDGWKTKGIFAASGSSGIALVIEDGITSIGDSAFGWNRLTSVVIPNSVTTIGYEAIPQQQHADFGDD